MLYELYHHPLNPPVATFSSYIFTLLTHPDPNMLKRCAKPACYWERDLWVIPRHRQSHWTLVIVVVSTRQILTFDSFGDRDSWQQDTKVRSLSAPLSRL